MENKKNVSEINEQTRLLRRIVELEKELVLAKAQADYDGLTGCLRRETLYKILEKRRTLGFMPKHMSVAVIDVDHFKKINDTRGHSKGDEVLREVAETLRRGLAHGSLLCRMGGEEFVVISESPLELSLCEFETLRQTIENETAVTVSVGVSKWDTDVPLSSALEAADMAMYQAKQAGRNQLKLAA